MTHTYDNNLESRFSHIAQWMFVLAQPGEGLLAHLGVYIIKCTVWEWIHILLAPFIIIVFKKHFVNNKVQLSFGIQACVFLSTHDEPLHHMPSFHYASTPPAVSKNSYSMATTWERLSVTNNSPINAIIPQQNTPAHRPAVRYLGCQTPPFWVLQLNWSSAWSLNPPC